MHDHVVVEYMTFDDTHACASMTRTSKCIRCKTEMSASSHVTPLTRPAQSRGFSSSHGSLILKLPRSYYLGHRAQPTYIEDDNPRLGWMARLVRKAVRTNDTNPARARDDLADLEVSPGFIFQSFEPGSLMGHRLLDWRFLHQLTQLIKNLWEQRQRKNFLHD